MFSALVLLTLAPSDELFPNAGFETGTLEGWTAEGDAFANQPTRGDNPAARGRETAAADGDFWVGTYENRGPDGGEPGDIRGDGKTGTLTSPAFEVTRPYLKFRVGGGKDADRLGVKLVAADGTERYLSTGFDSETMEPVTADVSAFIGQKARLVVYDRSTGGWGHVNVDAFEAADEPLPPPSAFRFTRGIAADPGPADYGQALRPRFHFTARRGWINDPNGMVFDGRRFHLFFQHNPKGVQWGNMTWGHAVSEDMVRWRQEPHALLPYRVDGLDGTVFSGTAVVDHNDSLGLWDGVGPKTIAAFFTFANTGPFYQALAVSTDGGETFAYHNEGRPVVPNQGFDNGERDPKVFWHEPSGRWVMVLWVERENPEKGTKGRVRFFTSENLTDWEAASDLVRPWAYECMDVVFLPLDGDAGDVKAVVYDASFDYEVGAFDGREFRSETPALKAGRGNYYAAQTFNDMPAEADGTRRAVQFGWMKDPHGQVDKHGLPFNGQMSVANELTLRSTPDGPRLFVYPAEELSKLVARTHAAEDLSAAEAGAFLAGLGDVDAADVEIEFEPRGAASVTIDLPRASLTWHADGRVSHRAVDEDGKALDATTLQGAVPKDGAVALRVLVDRMSVEAYAHGGESFGAHVTQPEAAPRSASLRAEGGRPRVRRLEVRELGSIWD